MLPTDDRMRHLVRHGKDPVPNHYAEFVRVVGQVRRSDDEDDLAATSDRRRVGGAYLPDDGLGIEQVRADSNTQGKRRDGHSGEDKPSRCTSDYLAMHVRVRSRARRVHYSSVSRRQIRSSETKPARQSLQRTLSTR